MALPGPWAISQMGVDNLQNWRTQVPTCSPFSATVMDSGPRLRSAPLALKPQCFQLCSPTALPHGAPLWLLGMEEGEEGYTIESLLCGWHCAKYFTIIIPSDPHNGPEKPVVP